MVRGNVGWRAALGGVAVVAFLAGCATSKPDLKLEAAATDWQQQVRDFIAGAEAKAGTPEGEYEASKKFYEDLQKDIGGNKARVKDAGGSARALEILETLSRNIEDLRQLHEQGGKNGLTRAVGEGARELIDAQFRALHKLESEYRTAPENG